MRSPKYLPVALLFRLPPLGRQLASARSDIRGKILSKMSLGTGRVPGAKFGQFPLAG